MSSKGTHTADRSGFTVIELLVALMILSFGLLALAGGMSSMSQLQGLATNRSEMVQAADTKVEHLRMAANNRTADTIQVVVGGSVTTPTAPYADTISTRRGIQLVRLWSVTAGPAGSRSVQLRTKPLVDTPRSPRAVDINTLISIR